MAVDYSRTFNRLALFAEMFSLGIDFRANIDAALLDHMAVLSREVPDSDNLADLIVTDNDYKTTITGQDSTYKGQLDVYLTTEGRDEIQSVGQDAEAVVEDLAAFMLRDGETILSNVVGSSIDYSRSGDGIASTVTVNQFAVDGERITLSCITAQAGATPAVFSVTSKLRGNLSGKVTADGLTSYSDTELGADVGISALVVDAGTISTGEWVVSDKIIIDLTSDEASIYMVTFRDQYGVILPNSASPTIPNAIIPGGSSFPGSPSDGDRFVLNGVLYFYNGTLGEWVESCL